jgi:hypothetical protein
MNIIEAETVCPPKTKPKNLSHFAIGGTGIRTPPSRGQEWGPSILKAISCARGAPAAKPSRDAVIENSKRQPQAQLGQRTLGRKATRQINRRSTNQFASESLFRVSVIVPPSRTCDIATDSSVLFEPKVTTFRQNLPMRFESTAVTIGEKSF